MSRAEGAKRRRRAPTLLEPRPKERSDAGARRKALAPGSWTWPKCVTATVPEPPTSALAGAGTVRVKVAMLTLTRTTDGIAALAEPGQNWLSRERASPSFCMTSDRRTWSEASFALAFDCRSS